MFPTLLRPSLALMALLCTLPALAAEYEVKMLDKGREGSMVFEPAFLRIAPGDTVRFEPMNKGHTVASIPGMLPPGAAGFVGAFNAETDVTFAKPGVYGLQCPPHYGMGMVALVVVGTPDNEPVTKAVHHPLHAAERFEALFAILDGKAAAGP